MDIDQKNSKNINHDALKWIIVGLAGFMAVVLIFGAGMFIGGMKAKFSYGWAESYHKNFGGPREGFVENWQNFPAEDFIGAHGLFGQIIKIDGSTFVIKGGDGVEKILLIKDSTVIRRLRNTIKITDLKVTDYIFAIGDPNDAGQIEAKLVRLLPPPPGKPSSMSTPPPGTSFVPPPLPLD